MTRNSFAAVVTFKFRHFTQRVTQQWLANLTSRL